MADNVAITAGAGTTVGADEVTDGTLGVVKVQYVKLMDGTLDGTTKATVGANGLAVAAVVSAPVFVRISDGSAAVDAPIPAALHRGTAGTFRIPGRAGTTGQKIMSLHNATGSSVIVRITQVHIDLVQTVVKAVTVLPPVIRMYKVTVLPTNGTALTKVSRDSALSASSTSVTLLQDASADGTSSASALTATLPAGAVVTGEFAPRLITAAGYEMFDRTEFLSDGEIIVLRALEGVVVMLDYVLATQNPITDMWVAAIKWTESAT